MWYYAPDNETVFGLKCIKLKTSNAEPEWEINSKYGFVWEFSSSEGRAIITNHHIANKFLDDQYRLKKGEELLIKFPAIDILKIVKLLKIRNNRAAMIIRANNFAIGNGSSARHFNF